MSKSELKRILGELEGFEKPKISLEQYITPPSLAADLIYFAYMNGDIENEKVVDLGSGTGMLGIGALVLGGEVRFVEKDEEAVEILKNNLSKVNTTKSFEIDVLDVENLENKFKTVLMNHPFSDHSEEGADVFWETALRVGDVIYSISPRGFNERIKDFVRNTDYRLTDTENYLISLPPTYGFHTKENRKTEVEINVVRRFD